MSSSLMSLLRGYFNDELIHVRPSLRQSLHNGGRAAVEKTRAEFDQVLRNRTLTREEFRQATAVHFADDAQLYRALEDAYRFLFTEPPTPLM